MSARQQHPAYDDDLAYVGDARFGGFAAGSAPGLLKMLRDAAIHDGLIVDLGCGSGIWAGYLADTGYRVIGVDISPAMIALARQRAPGAEFHTAPLLGFELPRCRAITALGEVVCYEFDAANRGRPSLRRLFRRAFGALEPGGLLVFDIAEVGLDRDRPLAFWEGEDWACAVRFEYDTRRDRLSRHIVTFRRVGALYRRHEETHRLQLYRRGEVAAMLRSAGFRVRTTRKYGEHPLPAGRIGFVARKPGKQDGLPSRP